MRISKYYFPLRKDAVLDALDAWLVGRIDRNYTADLSDKLLNRFRTAVAQDSALEEMTRELDVYSSFSRKEQLSTAKDYFTERCSYLKKLSLRVLEEREPENKDCMRKMLSAGVPLLSFVNRVRMYREFDGSLDKGTIEQAFKEVFGGRQGFTRCMSAMYDCYVELICHDDDFTQRERDTLISCKNIIGSQIQEINEHLFGDL